MPKKTPLRKNRKEKSLMQRVVPKSRHRKGTSSKENLRGRVEKGKVLLGWETVDVTRTNKKTSLGHAEDLVQVQSCTSKKMVRYKNNKKALGCVQKSKQKGGLRCIAGSRKEK